MENKQTLIQYTMSYGAILGIILILLSLLLYFFGVMPDTFGKIMLLPTINAAIVIAFVVVSTKTYRNKVLEGYISFKSAFLVGLLVVFFAYVLSGFYDLVFNLLIDPGYVERVYEGLTNWMYDFYSEMGVPDSQIDTIIERLENQIENYSPISAFFSGIFGSTAMGAVLCLITAAILKKEPLPFGQDEQ